MPSTPDAVASGGVHLLDADDLGAVAGGLHGGGQARHAQAHHQHVGVERLLDVGGRHVLVGCSCSFSWAVGSLSGFGAQPASPAPAARPQAAATPRNERRERGAKARSRVRRGCSGPCCSGAWGEESVRSLSMSAFLVFRLWSGIWTHLTRWPRARRVRWANRSLRVSLPLPARSPRASTLARHGNGLPVQGLFGLDDVAVELYRAQGRVDAQLVGQVPAAGEIRFQGRPCAARRLSAPP